MEDTPHVIVNPSFHLRAGVNHEDTPEYLEYRRRWNENPANDVVGEFPIHLDIETTSACNLRCPMCFQGQDDTRPEYGVMPWSTFTRVIDEGATKGLASIKLQYRGEPLLSENLEEMVAYAKNAGVTEVMFNTNATLLTEDRARGLIAAGLDKIICSVDGHTADIYNPIRIFPSRPGNFEEVLGNIMGLRRIRDELGRTKPHIRVQMVDMPSNHRYVERYVEFWMAHGADAVAVDELLDYHAEYADQQSGREVSHDRIYPEFRCDQPWQRVFVLWNGKVTMCCGDHYQREPLGQLFDAATRESYLGQLRKAEASGTLALVDGLYHAVPERRIKEVTQLVGRRAAEHGALEFVGVLDQHGGLVPECTDIESVWTGGRLGRVRDEHRKGLSHLINACSTCSMRDASHRAYLRGGGASR